MLVSRIFSTNEDATGAVGDLEQAGFRRAAIQVISATEGDASEAALVKSGVTPAHAAPYAAAVSKGGTLVLVEAPPGGAVAVKAILETARPGDAGAATAEYEAVARPELSKSGTTSASVSAADSATPLSSALNWPVLLDDPAPLSKWLNWRTLTAPPTEKPTSHGLPFLSDDPTPLSSKLGLKVLSDNPAPLSTKMNRNVISDDPTPLSNRFNWRVLLDNPSPLSSWLGIAVLSSDKKS